ncbi:MAG: hypothetical protein R2788_00925 [Saprospiraceae bacterium]
MHKKRLPCATARDNAAKEKERIVEGMAAARESKSRDSQNSGEEVAKSIEEAKAKEQVVKQQSADEVAEARKAAEEIAKAQEQASQKVKGGD